MIESVVGQSNPTIFLQRFGTNIVPIYLRLRQIMGIFILKHQKVF